MTRNGALPRAADDAQERGVARSAFWMRASYWWFFAGIGALTPFLVLHYRQLGLDGARVGLLASIPSVAVALLAPIWGAAADSWSAHKLVLRTSLCTGAVAAVLLARADQFVAIFAIVVLLGVAIAPAPSLLDSFGVALSERSGLSYGSLRVWGSVGYMLAAWTVGRLMGGEVTTLFLWAYALALLLTLASTLGLPRPSAASGDPVWRGVSSVLANRQLVLLLLTSAIVSTGLGAMYSFFGVYFIDIGGDSSGLGLALALAGLSELPMIAIGGRLLAAFGPGRMLVGAISVYCMRLLLYSFIDDPRWVLPVQLLHGLSFGVYLTASVTLAHRLAGRKLAATAQGMLTAVSFGVGSLVGAAALFRIAGFVMLLALAVLILGQRLLGASWSATPVKVGT